jgi:hypothetical protein
MAVRLPASVSKLAILSVLALGGAATIAYAAEEQVTASPVGSAPATASPPAEIVVPDVRRQAFVFAKVALQDAGLAWRVAGSVQGYAANVVVSQTPAAGTRLEDTGAPLVTLTLERNHKYKQTGMPQAASPYRATAVKLAEAAAAVGKTPAQQPAAATPAAKPATPKPAAAKRAAAKSAAAKPAAARPAAPKPAAAKPAASAAKPAAATKAAYPQKRPAAFAVAGAPTEPLDEMPLVDRARALGAWVATKPKPSDANVHHWLFQNHWIVTGARFGWWRGAEALRILIAVDRRTESVWGIGSKSRDAAVRALTEVEARSK